MPGQRRGGQYSAAHSAGDNPLDGTVFQQEKQAAAVAVSIPAELDILLSLDAHFKVPGGLPVARNVDGVAHILTFTPAARLPDGHRFHEELHEIHRGGGAR